MLSISCYDFLPTKKGNITKKRARSRGYPTSINYINKISRILDPIPPPPFFDKFTAYANIDE